MIPDSGRDSLLTEGNNLTRNISKDGGLQNKAILDDGRFSSTLKDLLGRNKFEKTVGNIQMAKYKEYKKFKEIKTDVLERTQRSTVDHSELQT